MSLSPLQDHLICKVAKAAPKSILINQSGSPIALPWIDDLDAILQCWYAGQEVGNALADIISGEVSPSGGLPVTFPRAIEDSPSFGSFPTDEKMEVRYAEGLEMGYRAYKPAPLFLFGFGLSYAHFTITGLSLISNESSPFDIAVSTTITNDGPERGKEVVQVYVDGVLKGFRRVLLETGASREVEIPLDKYAFNEWDPDRSSWVVVDRDYIIELRQDARTTIASLPYKIETRTFWNKS